MSKLPAINGYIINSKRLLGEGGNSCVYTATTREEEKVAIKILKESEENFKKKLKRFKIEVNKVKEIQEEMPNILPILDCNLKESPYWYTMPIATPITRYFKGNNNIDDKIKAIIEIAKSLQKLHSRGISHRDIKPNNLYCYKDRFALADFGLIDYPNKESITKTNERIGNRETIAPEMEESPKTADPIKADIYSLAKTLWMLLTNEKKGFEGIYNRDSKKMGLSNYFKGEHLIELEKLLHTCTQDSPDLRLNIEEFIKQLEKYLEIRQSNDEISRSQWGFIYETLFNKVKPETATFQNLEDIIAVLNLAATLPHINHMFLPDGGGLDFDRAEKVSEAGCIALFSKGVSPIVLKPKFLRLEHLGTDYLFNYFWLEADTLDVQFPPRGNEFKFEYMVEDFPGHYIQSKYDYCRRYEDDREFPSDARIIRRYLSGVFVLFAKASIYNDIGRTYDGRHDKVNADFFKKYISAMKIIFNICLENKKFDLFEEFSEMPLSKKAEKPTVKLQDDKDLESFIISNCGTWCFDDIVNKFNNNPNVFVMFSLEFDPIATNFADGLNNRYYLSENAKFLQRNDFRGEEKDRFYFKVEPEEILNVKNEIENKIKAILHDNGKQWSDFCYHIIITLHKNKNPIHIFTEQEVFSVLRNGDDLKNNVLAMDGGGFVHLIDLDKRSLYPIKCETFSARNNYVGKFADLSDVHSTYLFLLEGLLGYLRTGEDQYQDILCSGLSEKDLLAEINKLL